MGDWWVPDWQTLYAGDNQPCGPNVGQRTYLVVSCASRKRFCNPTRLLLFLRVPSLALVFVGDGDGTGNWYESRKRECKVTKVRGAKATESGKPCLYATHCWDAKFAQRRETAEHVLLPERCMPTICMKSDRAGQARDAFSDAEGCDQGQNGLTSQISGHSKDSESAIPGGNHHDPNLGADQTSCQVCREDAFSRT